MHNTHKNHGIMSSSFQFIPAGRTLKTCKEGKGVKPNCTVLPADLGLFQMVFDDTTGMSLCTCLAGDRGWVDCVLSATLSFLCDACASMAVCGPTRAQVGARAS